MLLIFAYYFLTIAVALFDWKVAHITTRPGDSDAQAIWRGLLWPFYLHAPDVWWARFLWRAFSSQA